MDEKKEELELERRIEEVEKETGIPGMTKKDYIVAVVFAGICLLGVILGGLVL